MPKTRAELVDRAMKALGVHPSGADPDITTRTRAQLVERAMRVLGVVPSGTDPDPTSRPRAELIAEAIRTLGILPSATNPDTGTRTRTELVAHALHVLAMIPSGQPLAAEDTTRVDTYLSPLLASLANRGIVTGLSLTTFQSKFFLPLAKCLAIAAASEFGVQIATRSDLAGEPLKSEAELRAIQHPAELLVRMEIALNSMLGSLANRGIVAGLSLTTFQSKFFNPLVRLLAASMAPEFGIQLASRPDLAGEPLKSEAELRAIQHPEELSARVDLALNSMLGGLALKGIVPSPSSGSFEQKFFNPLVRLLAASMAPEFGIQLASRPDLAAEPSRSEEELRAIQRPEQLRGAMDFLVSSLVSGLALRGIVTLSTFATVPSKYFIPLSRLLAYAGASDQGIKIDARPELLGEPKRSEEELLAIQMPERLRVVLDGLVAPLFTNLSRRGVFYLPNLTSIPDEPFIPLSRLLAHMGASDPGIKIQTRPELIMEPVRSENELRALRFTREADDPIRFTSY